MRNAGDELLRVDFVLVILRHVVDRLKLRLRKAVPHFAGTRRRVQRRLGLAPGVRMNPHISWIIEIVHERRKILVGNMIRIRTLAQPWAADTISPEAVTLVV
jgi:hypothetical protein